MTPKYDWALDFFGGRNPSKDFMGASNIVFANGDLDPWHAGGITTNVTVNTIALYIENSAHHLDLRLPNAADPPSVTSARAVETAYVRRWVEDYQGIVISSKNEL
jgi:lysosomal Pro-X carboxypeptidase